MPSSPYRHFERSPRSFLHIGVLTGWLYYQARLFYHLSVTLCCSPYRHFERSREILLAHRLYYRMAQLVCMFPTLSHTHHFPSCHEDPSASLGMTPWEERCLSSVGANPLPFGHPPSNGRGYDSHPPSSGRRGGGWPPACLTILIPVSS